MKSRLKRLPQGDETWEADFQALPKPISSPQTHYLGMVVTGKDGSLLADSQVHGRPSVNDLATLLAHAMRRPLDSDARRPKLVRLRGHHQWRGLFPHLEEIGVGVEVIVGQSLPGIEEAYESHLRRLRDEAQKPGWSSQRPSRSKAGAKFPAIDRWVKGYGWVEIGVQELFGFVTRAFSHEGEAPRWRTTAPARWPRRWPPWRWALWRWFEEQGVENE